MQRRCIYSAAKVRVRVGARSKRRVGRKRWGRSGGGGQWGGRGRRYEWLWLEASKLRDPGREGSGAEWLGGHGPLCGPSLWRGRKGEPFVSSFLKAQETGPYVPAIKPSERAFQFVGLEVDNRFRNVAGIAVVAGEGTDHRRSRGSTQPPTNEFLSTPQLNGAI